MKSISNFLDNIWFAIRDPKFHIRESAVNALFLSEAIKSKDSEFIYSSPMTRKEFVDYKNDSYCIDELETNSSGCINIPFNTLFIVIFIAMIIGILFDILAIRRIAEKNEIP